MEELILPDTLELVITAGIVRATTDFYDGRHCHIAKDAE